MRSLVIVFGLMGCSSNPGTGSDAAPDQMHAMETSMEGGSSMCTAVIEQTLKPIDMVSTGAVTILNETNGVRIVYVDASAGGFQVQDSFPRTYLNLETATRVDVTDKSARTSTMWDLAIKRPILYTNGSDGGPGMGASLFVAKAFDQITMADAMGKTFALEHFTDQDCNPEMDATGALLTTFDGWYDYNQMTMIVTPKPNTAFIVRGATGKLYKLAILTYYSSPDGGTGMAGGIYTLKIAAL